MSSDSDSVQLALLTRLAHLSASIKKMEKDIKLYMAGRKNTDRTNGVYDWQADDQPISFRNNNPGNLRPTASTVMRWRGEVDTDNGYAKFKDITHGTRAMLYLLKISYRRRHGLTTIKAIVDRYAPLHDNSIASHAGYIGFLEKQLSHFDDPCDFDDKRVLFAFARAIARFESGKTTTPLTGARGLLVLEAAYDMLPG